MADQEEKSVGSGTQLDEPVVTRAEGTVQNTDANGHQEVLAEKHREPEFMTRNGLNFKSFQRRNQGEGIVELDRSMESRHLHMIAIGTSLVWPPPYLVLHAGFFADSGCPPQVVPLVPVSSLVPAVP